MGGIEEIWLTFFFILEQSLIYYSKIPSKCVSAEMWIHVKINVRTKHFSQRKYLEKHEVSVMKKAPGKKTW